MEYYTKTDIEKAIYKEIAINKELAIKSDMKAYEGWYYPLIKQCFYMMVRFNIKTFPEIDNLFDEINKEIKSKIESGDRNV